LERRSEEKRLKVVAIKLLEVKNLTKKFGGFLAVSGLSFHIYPGEVVGLVGPNGAGKTTTLNMICGFMKVSQGTVLFKNKNITNLSAHQVAQMGLVRTFQLNKVFLNLTVEENIQIGCYKQDKEGLFRVLFGSVRQKDSVVEEKVEYILHLIMLHDQRHSIAKDLPYGDQKLLAIGIALGAQPELLLLDEPFAGMNPVETDRCISSLRQIVEGGTTLFLIDHNMQAVVQFCDRIIVMNLGKKIAEGPPQQIVQDPHVIRCYLGDAQDANS